MNKLSRPFLLCCALLALTLTGCESAPESAFRAWITSTNALADTLQRVKDAESARSVVDELDTRFTEMIAAEKNAMKYKDEKILETRLKELTADMEKAMTRMKTEMERLSKVRGLPIEFWKVMKVRGTEFIVAMLDGLPDVAAADRERMRRAHSLLTTHGLERLAVVELANYSPALRDKAIERFKKAAPGAEVHEEQEDGKWKYIVAPVSDFRKFTAALDLGTATFEDESQRKICIDFDRRKLGALASSDSEEARLRAEQMRQDSERRHQESLAAMEAARQRREEEEKKKRLDPSAPDYYEKLADHMVSKNPFEQSEAIDLLLRIDPAKVTSAETRTKIARGFKELAEEGRFDNQRKAVKGLVIWGGKFSVPILLKLLDNHDKTLAREVIKALGELKDPRGAAPVAARLSDFFMRDEAQGALRNMGSVAEDALIEVAPTEDPRVCLAAVSLLGEVGTAKSFKVLRMGLTSRNAEVRLASKNAIARINTRREAAGEKEKDKEN